MGWAILSRQILGLQVTQDQLTMSSALTVQSIQLHRHPLGLVGNAASQAPPQACWIRICILTRSLVHPKKTDCFSSTTSVYFLVPVPLQFPPPEILFFLSQNIQILLVTFVTKCVGFFPLVIMNWIFPLEISWLILSCKKFVNFLVLLFNLMNNFIFLWILLDCN